MNDRQLRAALAVIEPDDLPTTFDLGRGVVVTDPAVYVERVRIEAASDRQGWQSDFRTALGHLANPDDFRRRYDAERERQQLEEATP